MVNVYKNDKEKAIVEQLEEFLKDLGFRIVKIRITKINEDNNCAMAIERINLTPVNLHDCRKVYNSLQNLINEMTETEKNDLISKDFKTLWTALWGEYVGMQYRSEELSAKEKFKQLSSGIQLKNGKQYNLKDLIKNSPKIWKTPEWGFPKGRRNYQENDISCALREFEEETGYNRKGINILQNIIPFEETFTGSNFKSYKHKYYLSYIHNEIKPAANFQTTEVSQVSWMSLEDCMNHIRPYNLEKKEVLLQINNALEKYRLIS